MIEEKETGRGIAPKPLGRTVNQNLLRRSLFRDPILATLSILAKEKDLPLYLVGGYLRDLMLGLRRKDYDLASPGHVLARTPEIEEALGYHFFKVGKEALGTATYRIVKGDLSVDLTPFQGETIDDDLQRRDFTINAMGFSLRDETFHGVARATDDIENRIIRTVSDRSIDQDPVRMLRALRYLSTLDGFVLDDALTREISIKREQITRMPGERIKMELDRILLGSRFPLGVRLLYDTGLLLVLFPELERLEPIGQGAYHHQLNALSHTLLAVEKTRWASEWVAARLKGIELSEEDGLVLRYAALFHDIGKQDTYSQDEKGKVHFYHHESFSCQAAERIMERLRFSNVLRDRVLNLIRNHMRIPNLAQEAKETALKRLVHQIGDDTPLLVHHTLADKEASRGILSIPRDEVVEEHCLRILQFFKEKEIVHPPPLVTGHEVMAFGTSPGPQVGMILRAIRLKQVEGEIKTREEALSALKVLSEALNHENKPAKS